MRQTQTPLPSPHHQRLLGATVLWLSAGILLLLSTLVPAHTAWLGWTPGFWLIGAPLVLLVALAPNLPRRAMKQRRSRWRSMVDNATWH